jgi:hypothetical protein
MSDQAKLKVRFDEVRHGWMSVQLNVGETSFSFFASYTPYDSIEELIRALYNVLTWSESDSVVRWGDEPDEYEFSLKAANGQILVVIYEVTERIAGRARDEVFSFRVARLKLLFLSGGHCAISKPIRNSTTKGNGAGLSPRVRWRP